jgi:hypothetical protein
MPREWSFSLQLHEAVLDDGMLVIDAGDLPPTIQCRISQANVRPVMLKLGANQGFGIRIQLAPDLARRMANAPSVIQLGNTGGDGWEAASNPLLVVASMGPESGKNSRQHRRIKEAIESPKKFMGVLRELCESDDETRLKNFLTHCDIPFEANLRAFGGKTPSKSGQGLPLTEFKDLGTRNLRHFDMLHDATLHFVARHRARLEKHVKTGIPAGIPNFLHILESIIRLLHSQIERAASGLEAETETILSADEWKRIRESLSDYYRALESLLRLTTEDYVAGLLRAEKKKAVVEGFGSATEEILTLLTECLKIRARINTARIERIYVKTQTGEVGKAIFFGEQISDEKWKDYFFSLKHLAEGLRKQLAA